MKGHFNGLFTFYLLFSVSSSQTLSRIETIKNADCPDTSNLLEYCVAEFHSCHSQRSTFHFCNAQFRDCTKEGPPVHEQSCDVDIKNMIFKVGKTESQFQRKFSFDWPEGIVMIVARIEKDCDVKILDDSLSALRTLLELLRTNECVGKYKPELDRSMIEMDETTSKTLPIPFERFRCGWQFGYIGVVLFRHWVSAECGSYGGININHCCAEHLNCYMDNNEKTVCDELLLSCQDNVVNKMTSFKASCQSLVNRQKQENLFELEDYEGIKKTKMDTKLDMFDGNFNTALSMKDTQALNFTVLQVFWLGSDDSVDSEVRDSFNKNAYKYGWPKRVLIDSCGLMFEECHEQETNNVCLRRFEICLHSSDGKTEDFKQFLNQFSTVVKSQLQNILTKKDFDKFKEETSHSKLFEICEIGTMVYCLGSLCWSIIKQIRKRAPCFKYRTVTASQIISPSNSIPLDDLRSEQTQPLNRTVHHPFADGTVRSDTQPLSN